ncbi:Inorganic triphosphatase [Methylophilaceae bacterium]|nr:Inorganic triphosphatase [Methylophilaceae bacterium]
MPNEIELKLRIAPEDVLRLRRHPAIRSHLTGKPITRRLVSTYYDTPDLQLLKKQISLRVRRMSGKWFQAVKGAGHSLAGLHQRMEWEDIIARGAPDFTKITAPSLIRIFADQTLRDALQPIFLTDVQRTEWQLAYEDGTEIEVALDLGKLEAGDRSEPIREVELELKKGETGRLFELAALLQQSIPLHIENISKAERGYRYYYTHNKKTASRARRTDLPARSSRMAAFQVIGLECLRQIQANQELVMAGDIEATHQMHIAVRRLKVAFRLFKFKNREIRREIGWLNALIGSTRNWDVLVSEILPALNQSGQYDQLQQLASRKQHASYRKLQKAIDSQRYQAMLLQLGIVLTKKPGKDGHSIKKLLHRNLHDIYDSLPWDKKRLSDLSEEDLHQTRIKIKRLRYSQEFFALPELKLLSSRSMISLQKTMGILNDIHVGKPLLEATAKGLPIPQRQALAEEISGWENRLVQRTRRKMQSSWKKLRDQKTRHN